MDVLPELRRQPNSHSHTLSRHITSQVRHWQMVKTSLAWRRTSAPHWAPKCSRSQMTKQVDVGRLFIKSVDRKQCFLSH